jgi:acyl-CoA synthetase (AMP-forming)/AMP-acid ligase II
MSTVSLTRSTRDCAPGLTESTPSAVHATWRGPSVSTLCSTSSMRGRLMNPTRFRCCPSTRSGRLWPSSQRLIWRAPRARQRAVLFDLGVSEDDDDVITSGAYRIGPFEVESLPVQHPAVVEAAVGAERPERMEIVAAVCTLPPGWTGSPALARAAGVRQARHAPPNTSARSTSSTKCSGPSAARSGAPNCAGRCAADKTKAKWCVSQIRHPRNSLGVTHVRIRRP